MRRFRHHSRSRPSAAIVTAELAALCLVLSGLVFSVAIGEAGSATAQPAAGYTASLIPTGRTTSPAVDPDTDTVYFVGPEDYELMVVDGATNAVTTTIQLPAQPVGVAVDPVTDTIYASVEQLGSSPPMVAVIDGSTNTVTGTIPLPVDSDPQGVAVNSSTDTVYVADYAQAVSVIDGSTNSLTTTVSTGSGTTPAALAVDETTNVVWVGDTVGDVQAISGASDTVTETINPGSDVGIEPSMAVDPATDTVYAATEPGLVTIIDGATGTVSSTISPGTASTVYAVAVDPGTGTVFASAAGEWGTTWVIDASSNTVTDTIARGGRQVAVNTATGSAYEAPEFAGVDVSWALTPSAANAMSPVFATTVPALTEGTAASIALVGSALPAATYSETGQLPAGVTMSSAGVFSGTPAAGSGGVYTITVTASNGVPPDYSPTVTLTVDGAASATYVPLDPVRILDTRNGTGGFTGPIGPGGVLSLPVTGVNGVPATDVTAVVLNVTVTDPTAGSYLAVYPDGQTRTASSPSNLNFSPGETIPNLVVVPVGADGNVDFYNDLGSTQLVVDLEGYYYTSS
jgi:DNA-binding beta-propeller fold protein YncE